MWEGATTYSASRAESYHVVRMFARLNWVWRVAKLPRPLTLVGPNCLLRVVVVSGGSTEPAQLQGDRIVEITLAAEELQEQRDLVSKLDAEGWDIIVGAAFIRGMRDIGYKGTSYA